MSERTRVDNYRGRKDSALALHYLWRVGEAMVTRRERFERVYALTEAVAPASALREVDDAEADDVLVRKVVAAAGLTQLNGIATMYVYGHKATGAELEALRDRWLSDGSLVEVQVEGWRATQVRSGADATILAALEAGGCRPTGRRSRRRPTRRRRSCRRSIRSAPAVVPSRCSASTTSGRSTSRSRSDAFGYYTMPILWGDRLVGRFDPKLDRTTSTLVINGLWLEDERLPATRRSATRWRPG